MTAATGHTPGPWELVPRKEGWVVKSADGCVLAGVSQFPPPAELAPQCVHNARLIAAAPQMLEALRAVDSAWTAFWPAGPDGDDVSGERVFAIAEETRVIWRQIRAALSAAEGVGK